MTSSLRHRAALVLTGVLISVPFWAAGVADAAAVTVTFSGQPLLGPSLSCPSTPSVSRLAVAAGTTVDFVNELGEPATLWAGDTKKGLPPGSLVPVTFTEGPASIAVWMLPDCTLDLGTHGQMRVTVTAPTAVAGKQGLRIGEPVPASGRSGGVDGLLILIATVGVVAVSGLAIRVINMQGIFQALYVQ